MNISALGARGRRRTRRTILSLVVVSFILATLPEIPAVQRTSLNQLEAKLNSEYAEIEKTIAGPPSRAQYRIVADYHQKLREWQPISNPELRTVFSSGEVQQSARLIYAPAAEYTDEARTAKTHGDVRLRMVLAADGTVKYMFAIKSLPHGLTESAMKAASAIQFEPAIRNAKPASLFITLVYEFKDGQARPPCIPKTIF